jgi:hypothetical protein
VLSHHIQATLASERRNTLLAEAQRARLARQSRLRRRQARPAVALRLRLSWLGWRLVAPLGTAPSSIRHELLEHATPSCW